jgi:hypothetical protein
MYHIEFYRKIKDIVGHNGSVLSGIMGDLYAGNFRFEPIKKASDIKRLAITHDLHADSEHCILKTDHAIENDFYEANKEKLQDENWRVLTAARMKISLLSYLLRIPEYEGFSAWSPFLDADVVAKMITLPWSLKNKRKWQVDYLRKLDLLVGEWGLNCSKENVLDNVAYKRYSFERLEYSYLGEVIKKKYIENINNCILLGRLNDGNHVKELNAWFTLYPLQEIMKKCG